jgi:ubiquinone/menaquinone biosynthesis C-methylase UbiE
MDAYDPENLEFKKITSLINFRKEERVLEIGIGNGRVAFKIAPYVKEVYGIDVDEKILKVARRRLKKTGLRNVIIVRGDIQCCPFKNDFFDAVLSPWVLHHVDNRKAALLEVNRMLKNGGTFLSIDVAHDNDYINLKGKANPKANEFVAKRTEKVLNAIKESLDVIFTQRFHSYYLLPTIKEVRMFFEEFDIPYEKLDESLINRFLEDRKTKKGYKISESAYITLARKIESQA